MPETDLAPRTTLKRSAPLLPWVLVTVAALAAGGALWLWRGRGAEPSAASPAAQPATPAAPAPEVAPAPDAATPASPADVRALLDGASAAPAWRRWLAEGDLVERLAATIENVALGESPRTHLAFLKPAGAFQVLERGGRSVIAPESYVRYDAVGDVAASLDAGALARVWRALHPALEAAFHALGYPRGALDATAAKALGRLAAAPAVDGDVAVVDEGGVWLYDDPALERLPEAEKHLLRMGPRNARLVQEKARELLGALGLPAPPPKAR
jgi:hypothetical protein